MRIRPVNEILCLLILLSGNCLAQNAEFNQFDEAGRRHGKWKKEYESTGSIRYQGQFEHGKEVGTFSFYTEDNPEEPKATKTYSPENDFVLIKYFNKKGKLKSKGKLKNRKRIGTWEYYFAKSGKKMMTEPYKNDKLHGVKKIFFRNGNLAKKQYFKNGKAHGVKEIFNEDGTLTKKYTYRNGKLEGPSKIFTDKGKLQMAGDYKNGRRHGKWKFYKNGNLKKTETFPKKNPAADRQTGEPDGYKRGGKPEVPEHIGN